VLRANFISRTGREITLPLVRSREQLFVQRANGTLTEFSDPLDDPILGLLSFVTADDTDLQPENRQTIRKLT
jgi:hypothetical protein